jgi:hypothetical protein
MPNTHKKPNSGFYPESGEIIKGDPMSNIPPPLPPSIPPAFTPPPLPQSVQSEIVQVVLENISQKSGVFSKQNFRVVITDKRLIFVVQTKNKVDYMKQAPDVSLAENPVNFQIPLEELVKVNTYKGVFDDNTPDMMDVTTATQKMRFQISNYYKVQKQLKEVLGHKAS